MEMESSGKLFLISEIPHFNLQFLNQFQAFIALFVVLDSYRRERYATIDAILIRPVSNVSYTVGKWLGMIGILLYVNILNIFITLVLHLFALNAPFSLIPYGFYLLFWTLPTLIFVTSLTYCIIHLTRNLFITLTAILLSLYVGINHLPNIFFGTFDPFADQITSLFSELLGFPDLHMYLVQRLTYTLWGISLLTISIRISKRIPNKIKTHGESSILAASLFIIGCVCCYYYGQTRQDEYTRRECYRQTYLSVENLPKVHTRKHDISFEQKNSTIYLNSKIVVENTLPRTLPQFILYLNPRLQITKLIAGQKELRYRRDNQIIYIDTLILPGDSICLNMAYQGKIEDQICYLDIPDAEYYKSLQTKRFAYTEKDYTLLTPECLWYPASRPPVSIHNPYSVVNDFTYFTLSVVHPTNETAISQGDAQKTKKGTNYTNRIPLPGISLVLGEYEKKCLQVDSTLVEIYYWKNHKNLISMYPTITNQDVQQARETIINFYQRSLPSYPYHKLAFAETPVHFSSWYRTWKKGSEFIQPEMVLASERGNPILPSLPEDHFQASLCAQQVLACLHEQTNPYYIINRKAIMLQNIFRVNFAMDESIFTSKYNDYYLSNTTISPIQIYDSTIPVLNHIVQLLLQEHANLIILDYQSENSQKSAYTLADAYLATHSLADMPKDTLPYYLTEIVLTRKATELYLYLNAKLSREGYNRFIECFSNTYRFQEISLTQFCQAIREQADINIENYLAAWYTQSGLPTFQIRDARCTPLVNPEGDTQYLITVKIHNASSREGFLCLRDTRIGIPSWKKYHDLAPNSFNEICIITEYPLREFFIDMGITRNKPALTKIEVKQVSSPIQRDVKEGLYPIDSLFFQSRTSDIIVDNTDTGFRLISPPRRKRLKDYFLVKQDKWFMLNDKLVTGVFNVVSDNSQWRNVYNPNYYGDIEKSAYQIEAGNGEFKAEWKTQLPRAGRYRVYCYIPPVNKMQTQKKGDMIVNTMLQEWQTYFCIRGTDQVHEIELTTVAYETGWVLLGTFDLSQGESKVILDNRGLPGTLVYADAVKWELTK
jgi:hypothetical protein